MEQQTYKNEVTRAFDKSAASYDRLGVTFFGPMGRRLVERLAPLPGERALDIGCGLGACLFPAAEAVGAGGHVVGIDIAPAMIERARAEAVRRRLTHVKLLVMDAEEPRLEAGTFDVAMGSYSLIFLPNVGAALRRYARILTDGGRIGFTSPVFRQDTFPFLPPVFTELIPRSLLSSLPPEWQPDALRRRFNSWLEHADDVRRTMEEAGFTEVRVEDESVDLVAPSGEVWVDWSHTHGMRLLWEHLSADEAQRLRCHLITELDAMREGDGPLTIDTPVRFVLATKAAVGATRPGSSEARSVGDRPQHILGRRAS
ncbi:class I SAM-dependent methyltransferase [Streptomyces sp. NPDC001118]